MRYLLDANAVIAYVEKKSDRLVRRMEAMEFSDIGLPSIVIQELAFGAYRSRKVETNLARLLTLSREISVVAFTLDDAQAAGAVRADLASRGTPIGPYDVLIAGQAKARDLCLVTNNTREFARVTGLKIEDWTSEDKVLKI